MTEKPAPKTHAEILCRNLPRYALRNYPYAPGYLDDDAEGEWCRYEDVLALIRGIVALKEAAK